MPTILDGERWTEISETEAEALVERNIIEFLRPSDADEDANGPIYVPMVPWGNVEREQHRLRDNGIGQ